jgi:hypothetical protein
VDCGCATHECECDLSTDPRDHANDLNRFERAEAATGAEAYEEYVEDKETAVRLQDLSIELEALVKQIWMEVESSNLSQLDKRRAEMGWYGKFKVNLKRDAYYAGRAFCTLEETIEALRGES